ncbi:amino acid adenylation domain-containing protein [Caldithrix abyssi]
MGVQNKQKNIEAIYPLSPLQQGMLFHYVYNPEAATYFEQLSVKLHGQVNPELLKQAWQTVVNRHSALRTSFVWKKVDKMLQVVHRQVPIELIQHDWRSLPENQQTQKLIEYAEADRKQGFNLAKAPLLRFHLIRLKDDLYQFIWSFHHLLADGWSMPIILKEAFTVYEAAVNKQPLQLPPVRPYKDYITWLQKQDLNRAREYWLSLLQDFTPAALPFIHPRDDETQNDFRAHEIIEFSEEFSEKLQNLARENQITINNLIQAAWGILLSRYLNNEDVVFGATVSGRPPQLHGVENMVGMFINTLPVRVRFDQRTTILDLLKDLQKQAAATRDVEFTPLVEIQGWLELPREMPLFDTIVVFENYPVDSAMQRVQASIQFSDFHSFEKSNYPLSLIAAFSNVLSLKLAYENARVDKEQIDLLIDQLKSILQSFVQNPRLRINEIPILNQAQKQRILQEWNALQIPFEDQITIHQKFEQTVEQQPERPAVVFQQQSLTFAQLNVKANQLAHFLIQQGVKPEDTIGLCMDRSIEMIVGLLGILKAGAAYVPLSPDYPEERLRFSVQDTGMKYLLTLKNNQPELKNLPLELIVLDDEQNAIHGQPTGNPALAVSPDNLAYIIYTSGSTGQPKGVMINHRSVMNLAANLQHFIYQPLNFKQANISLNAPLIFDASMQRIIMMMHGHTLHIIPEEIRGDGQAMVQFFRQNKIDLADGVPSQLKLMLEAGLLDEGARWPRAFTTGGEALDQKLWKTIQKQEQIVFFNMYGPTECTVDASITKIQGSGPRPTIGRALANTKFYVLNRNLQPTPIGAPGELHVSGENLARGYLKRADLTAQFFIPDPFSEKGGQRMYKTGDLVRWRPDGMLEFLGRVDAQVKLRGFRIELGEIENALRNHPQITDAVVILREDQPDTPYLAAYCLSDEPFIDRQDLRAFLRQHLPEYMLPTAFVFLDSFPLTASGKIFHRRLPRPQESDIAGGGEKIAPRNAAEELLATLWQDVLKIKEVGAFDNFFDLGGHSLLATQMVSRVRDAFGVELPLRQIFETPVLADLALKIEELKSQERGLQAPPITPAPRDKDLPLSFAQQRLWFLDRLSEGTANYNIPSAVRLKGHLNVDRLKQSIEEIVRRHEILRTTFEERRGDAVQVIHEHLKITIPTVDLSDLPEEQALRKARELARADALKPFDLEKGPLFRILLLKLNDNDHLVLFNMHHIITDGWSTGILVREMAAIYNALSDGKPSPLSPLPIQYADFTVWQQNWLQGEVLEKHLQFWQEYIGENPPVLELPTDHPRPAMQTFNGRSLRYDLPADLSQQVVKFSQKQGVTLFMTLLAAFQSLMHRYSGQDKILIGSPIANRNRSEIENLIGFFVNTLVFKAEFEHDLDFKTLVKQVRENTLQAYAHQDLPFEKLVEALQPERDMSHSPIFQVAFILQNMPSEQLKLKHITIESFPPENPTSKYDLTLYTGQCDNRLVCFWEYNSDLFEEATIRRMMQHFENLLRQATAHPDHKIDYIDFLTEQEKNWLFKEWNNTERPFPADKTVHALFEELAAKQHEQPAVQYEDQILSYDQLNRKANQLARYLKESGLQTDQIVGISLPRSLNVAVAILGILKAGGGFLNIDPAYPRDRIAYMIEDSGLRFVITDQKLAEMLPLDKTKAILLDRDGALIEKHSEQNLNLPIYPDNLAYVIYTSGSTGRPKGTLLGHRGLCNLFQAQQAAFNIRPHSRILQFSSLSFDASVWETVMALLNGATLVFTSQENLVTGQGLHAVLKDQKITAVTLPPSVLAVLPEEPLPELRTIITAGEKCTSDLVQRWGKGRQFVNAYGPTETTVCASMYETDPQAPIEPPIGKPIDNFQLYVVDQHLMPVPVGVPGELCIAGVGLARGYLNRPGLTAERFVANPFSKKAGERMYRSGDLVRWRSDGNLEFLGRIDHQVKLRGFRIELGEIEAILTGHPKIRDAAALVREDTPGHQLLVAYYVTEDGDSLVSGELKSYLKEQLPDYMVPAVFVHLKKMPLTPNGKVDRKALPKPDQQRDVSSAYVAPRNESEQTLAEIVGELLNLQKVGVHDNFFDLGGHSLLATKFMSRIREKFNVELPLRILFEKPTVAELAKAIEEQQSAPAEETITRVEREEKSLEELLTELDQLSDEEVKRLLDDERENDGE